MPQEQDNDVSAIKEQLLKREEVFQGNFLKVRRDTILTATNLTRTREYITHPGAACIICLFDDETTLIETQWRQPCQRAFVEFPAGKLDPAESPLACAKRELKEETGYEARQWHYLGRLHNALGYSNEKLELFLARDLTAGEQALDDGECLTVSRVPLKQVIEQCDNGTITDVKIVIGAYWAQRWLMGKMPEKSMP